MLAAEPIEHEGSEFGADPLHGRIFFAVPTGNAVRQSQDCQRCQPGIEVAAKFAPAHAVANDGFKYLLKPAGTICPPGGGFDWAGIGVA